MVAADPPPADPIALNRRVRALLRDLDLVAPGEREHAERTAVYAVTTGNALGLGREELRSLRYAALLHDVGKVRLDRATLRKLGTLTDDELAEMRRHAEAAVAVLEGIPELASALPGIRAHHERFDGTGYPHGLRGEEIPLAARIVGMCESFDVMSYGTPYSPRLETAAALLTIRAGTRTQWCPRVLEAFLTVQPLIQPLGLQS